MMIHRSIEIISDIHFQRWVEQIDSEIQHEIGLNLTELPDFPYYQHFDQGITPSQMASIILQDIEQLGDDVVWEDSALNNCQYAEIP